MTNQSAQLDMAIMRTLPDLSACAIPHPDPCVLRLAVGREQLSNVVDHVANVEYVRWLDRAAELHSDSLGYSRQWLAEHDVMWFVSRHEVDYLAETHAGDELVIATWVRDMQRIRSWREYVVYRPVDETIVCRAATLWVFVNLRTRRPMRIPDEMAVCFKALDQLVPIQFDGPTAGGAST